MAACFVIGCITPYWSNTEESNWDKRAADQWAKSHLGYTNYEIVCAKRNDSLADCNVKSNNNNYALCCSRYYCRNI